MMKLFRAGILGALAVVAGAGVIAAPAPLQAPASPRSVHPFLGVTYIEDAASSPREIRTHVLQIDLTAPGIRLMLTPPEGPRETVRSTTADLAARLHAQAAINAHFFLPFPSTDSAAWLVGFAASEGRVFSAFESPQQSFAIAANAPAINIDRANHASIVHVNASWPDGLHIRERVNVWTALAGSAQIVTDGAATVPVYKDATHPLGALTPGSSRNYTNGNSWYDVVTARSAIGLSKDRRTLTLFTVDARGGSAGMTVGEVAAALIDQYGVWDALNLDGGGSTSLALAYPDPRTVRLVNTSSDNPQGRSVASSLLVFARPRAATPK